MNQIPSAELHEMRCSHQDLPLITFKDFGNILTIYLNELYDQWITVASGNIHSEVSVLLSSMCQVLLAKFSTLVLEVVEMQILAHPHKHVPGDDESTSANTSNLMNSKPLLDGCSYCRVTEDDIQASFGNTLNTCFGEAMGVVQKKSYDSERLLELFSAEIAKRVNSALRHFTGSTSLQSDESTSPSNSIPMVYNVANILKACLTTLTPTHVAQRSVDSNGKSLDFPNFEEVEVVDQDPAETFVIIHSTTESIGYLQCPTPWPLPLDPKCSVNETFLTLCLAKLVNHIADKTNTSVENIDFHQIVTFVKERTLEEQSYTLPQRVKNLHITIYKELCHKFGSKYLLQAAMEKGDVAFAAAVAEMLKAQLKKSPEKKSNSKKMWRIFRRTNQVSPVCENKAPESHSEENKQKNGSTPSSQKTTKCSGIRRRFSSMFTALRKVFTSCMTSK